MTTVRKYSRMAILAAVEAAYGTDQAPTARANAMQMNDVTLTPLAGSEERRDLMLPWLGHQGVILTGNHVRIEGAVEIAGAGAAGAVPKYGPLLRACGLAETITAGTNVAYKPVSSGEESVSIHYIQDGVRHVALGTRGNVQLDFTPQRIPRFRFTLTGLLGTIADQALPRPRLDGFRKPLIVSKVNTTFSLHGHRAIAESVTFDLGNQIEQRLLIGHESMALTRSAGDRQHRCPGDEPCHGRLVRDRAGRDEGGPEPRSRNGRRPHRPGRRPGRADRTADAGPKQQHRQLHAAADADAIGRQ